jgi:class 3 adenylate cyclase
MPSPLKYTLKETNLAIVLLDLIGSTQFVQKVGPVTAARWLQYHDRLTRSLCYKFNGREIDRSDGFLMSFETTIDAVNFALKYQATVPEKTKLGCRIGIHWGKIVEVHQHELEVGVGVKQVELEGISKNIAARTMSLSNAGQVLLTKAAINNIRGRTNFQTPKGVRFACMGLYKFKGVTPAKEIYAVGTTIESLQPPKGTEKAERLGGPKRIKKLARDRLLIDWAEWIFWRLGVVTLCFWLYLLIPIIINPAARGMLGLPYYMPNFDWFVGVIIQLLKTAGL